MVIDFHTEVINLYNHLIYLIHSLLCIFVFFPFSFWEQFTSTWKTQLMNLMIWFDCSPWWHFVPLPICMARSSVHFKGPVTRYVKLRVAHALGTFSRHRGLAIWVTHVPWCMPGSLTVGFLWIRWWEKRSRQSWRMRNTQFYVSGNKPIVTHKCVANPSTLQWPYGSNLLLWHKWDKGVDD